MENLILITSNQRLEVPWIDTTYPTPKIKIEKESNWLMQRSLKLEKIMCQYYNRVFKFPEIYYEPDNLSLSFSPSPSSRTRNFLTSVAYGYRRGNLNFKGTINKRRKLIAISTRTINTTKYTHSIRWGFNIHEP